VSLRALPMLALALACLSASCRSESVMQPGGIACFLGPLELPTAADVTTSPQVCFTGTSGCPNKPPFGAAALVGLATCVDGGDATATAPCTPKVERCPLVNPDGDSPVRFLIARPGDACSAVVDVLLQASSNAGGAGIEWRVQDYEQSGSRCVVKGGPRVGLAAMPGPCCSTELEIPVPERDRTFRMIARSDWIQ
jgi:hypothetical protein